MCGKGGDLSSSRAQDLHHMCESRCQNTPPPNSCDAQLVAESGMVRILPASESVVDSILPTDATMLSDLLVRHVDIHRLQGRGYSVRPAASESCNQHWEQGQRARQTAVVVAS